MAFTKIYAEINKHPTPKELFKFGATLLGACAVIGAVLQFYAHKEPQAHGIWIAGGVAFVVSLIPPINRFFYILWMGLGLTMGLITSPIMLVVVFLLVITPVGLIMKAMARDAMKRKLDRKASSYWEDYPEHEDPATYVKQF
jgi:multisubunit Na+/H+ antiporter MnhG subunit